MTEEVRFFTALARGSEVEVDAMSLLLTIAAGTKKDMHVWGPREEDLREALPLLKGDRFNKALHKLLNSEQCIQHRYSQEGTAGPFAHRYQLALNVAVKATWDPIT